MACFSGTTAYFPAVGYRITGKPSTFYWNLCIPTPCKNRSLCLNKWASQRNRHVIHGLSPVPPEIFKNVFPPPAGVKRKKEGESRNGVIPLPDPQPNRPCSKVPLLDRLDENTFCTPPVKGFVAQTFHKPLAQRYCAVSVCRFIRPSVKSLGSP